MRCRGADEGVDGLSPPTKKEGLAHTRFDITAMKEEEALFDWAVSAILFAVGLRTTRWVYDHRTSTTIPQNSTISSVTAQWCSKATGKS